jgi:arylformamidase
MMAIYDISLTISPSMPVWPGDPVVEVSQVSFMSNGDSANVTRLAMSAHTGTHVDAPHHFLNDGRTVENLPLDVLTGPCFVAQLPDGIDSITRDVLEHQPLGEGTTRVLFGTGNSHLWAKGETEFQKNFIAITEGGARWLVEHGIRLVGVDYLSVAPFGDSTPTHRVLLEAGIVILEGLNLAQVQRGFYDLYCLPLKIGGSDGAPARAILIG